MTPTAKDDRRGAACLLVDDPRFGLHVPLGHHPERPERLVAVREAVAMLGARGTPCASGEGDASELGDATGSREGGAVTVGIDFERVASRSATDEELARVHSASFVAALAALQGERRQLDPDTYVSPDSAEVARLAAGSLVAMVDSIIDGPIPKGVALLRPPGHHARPAQAMGFCLFNNVAVAAAHARSRGLQRIAIVDWDVHHGNGTQEMFWRDPSILYLSTHQSPFYPGTGAADETGEGPGTGFTVNVPLAAGGGDGVYASAFERVVLPVLEAYAPELVLVSAGFDAAARDPLAQMQLSPSAFGWMAREVARVTGPAARGRMALVLEGGYDLVSLAAGMRSAIAGMVAGRAVDLPRAPDDRGVGDSAAAAHRAWRVVV